MGISQAFVYIALYGSIALIFWYGPYLARVECWNYNAGIVIIVCILYMFTVFAKKSHFYI
jgi:hypothetical protein